MPLTNNQVTQVARAKMLLQIISGAMIMGSIFFLLIVIFLSLGKELQWSVGVLELVGMAMGLGGLTAGLVVFPIIQSQQIEKLKLGFREATSTSLSPKGAGPLEGSRASTLFQGLGGEGQAPFGVGSKNSNSAEWSDSEVGSLLEKYQSLTIVRLALLEGAAFLNLVVFLVGHGVVALVMAGVALLAMFVIFPRGSHFDRLLDVTNR